MCDENTVRCRWSWPTYYHVRSRGGLAVSHDSKQERIGAYEFEVVVKKRKWLVRVAGCTTFPTHFVFSVSTNGAVEYSNWL
jgi:hypothetical protein